MWNSQSQKDYMFSLFEFDCVQLLLRTISNITRVTFLNSRDVLLDTIKRMAENRTSNTKNYFSVFSAVRGQSFGRSAFKLYVGLFKPTQYLKRVKSREFHPVGLGPIYGSTTWHFGSVYCFSAFAIDHSQHRTTRNLRLFLKLKKNQNVSVRLINSGLKSTDN